MVQALIFGVRAGSLGHFFELCLLCLVGIGRFIPCDVGADHCRLCHIGWEKCGHGFTSRPRESASEGFLNELPVLFHYPPRSAAALLGGTVQVGLLVGFPLGERVRLNRTTPAHLVGHGFRRDSVSATRSVETESLGASRF